MGLSPDRRKRERQLANLIPNARAAPVGNRRTVKHGAYACVAADRLDAKVREVFAAIREDAPLRGPDGSLPASDAIPARLLAEALVRLDDISAYLRDYGQVDPKTKQLRESVLDIEMKLRKEIADHAEAMGMGPRARMKLGLDVARAFEVHDERLRSADGAAARAELRLAEGAEEAS